MVTNPLALLWSGRCTIFEYEDVTDPNTHQTSQKEVIVVEDEPCRISYSTEPVTHTTTGVAEMSQFIVLFIRPDLEIDPLRVWEAQKCEKNH